MSREAKETRAQLLGELAQELRQLNGLSAAFFRAMAARLGVTVTDMQVIENLAGAGPMTAGQLADLTGLTTGAITGMLNRLEEAGLIQRERDPEDGRRVIVRLAPGKDSMREIGPVLDYVAKSWEELTATLDDEQIAFLVEFLSRGNEVSRKELAMLQAAPQNKEGIFSEPLAGAVSGRLVVTAGGFQLNLRGNADMAELYRAKFEGAMPDVKSKDGVVTIRYPRRLRMLVGQGSADVTLNAAIPWEIAIQGGSSQIDAELGTLALAGLELKGGMSMIHLELSTPSQIVPIHISGGASEIVIRRPAEVPARVRLKGWASTFNFDGQTFTNMGGDARLQSPGYDGTAPGYDIEVASSASIVTINAE